MSVVDNERRGDFNLQIALSFVVGGVPIGNDALSSAVGGVRYVEQTLW